MPTKTTACHTDREPEIGTVENALCGVPGIGVGQVPVLSGVARRCASSRNATEGVPYRLFDARKRKAAFAAFEFSGPCC
jgi:hypothetical protein